MQESKTSRKISTASSLWVRIKSDSSAINPDNSKNRIKKWWMLLWIELSSRMNQSNEASLVTIVFNKIKYTAVIRHVGEMRIPIRFCCGALKQKIKLQDFSPVSEP